MKDKKEKISEKVSIVVPVYNVRDYLTRCVNSLINQTYKNLEIILVDDGSTDGSADLCDRISESDSRVTVIHKANGGLSSARNAGLDFATGEYYTFIDSDDYVALNYVEALISVVVDYDTDIVCASFVTGGYDEYAFCNMDMSCEMLSYHEVLRRMIRNGYLQSACGKLFHKSKFNEIRFPEGRVLEDLATTYKVYDGDMRIALCNAELYLYYVRPDSIMHRKFNIDNAWGILSYKERLDYIYSINDIELLHLYVQQYVAILLSYYYQVKKNIGKEETICRFLVSEFNENFRTILTSPYLSVFVKAGVVFGKMTPFCAGALINQMI